MPPETKTDITLSVNGRPVRTSVEPRRRLLDLLRDDLGLTGTKCGCEDGVCGACTVLVDGRATKSCLRLAAQCDGIQVTTVEGLASADGTLHPVQEAFWEHHAIQDGFTTPALMIAAIDLLKRNPDPTDAEIREALAGTLCRITGYQSVVRAIRAAAERMRSGAAPAAVAATAPADLVGASIRQKEAPELLKGEARFIADIKVPGMLHAAILHSREAHAKIRGIDTSAAAAMPGVVRVFTGADTAHLMPLPVVWVPTDIPSHFPPHPSGIMPGSQTVLATDRARFVGDPLAVVVAETREQAWDALAKIAVDYEPLPVVIDAEKALEPGAPQLHDAVPGNLVARGTYGDKEKTDKAIAEAEVVVRQRFHNQRMSAHTIETRGSIGAYDENTGEYTLWTNVQPLYPVRLLISQYVLGIPYTKLRIIAPHFGGSQGSKGYLYVDMPLVLFLAKQLGRPVSWIDSRDGFSRSTAQGRDQVEYATLAGKKDGTITALSCTAISNIGAYPVINAPGQPRTLIGRSLPGSYVIPSSFYDVSIVLTNTVQVGPLRGSGRAEATFVIERLVDLFAREIGMDPAEVRRKNMVPPDRFPYQNGLGFTYDSGNYQVALDRALEKAGWKDIAARKAEAKKRGKRLGVGLASHVSVAGVGPSAQMQAEGLVSGTWGSANIRVHPTGEVSVTTGAQPHGQSQETTFAQIAASELGIPVEFVEVRHSDTNGALYYAQASYGSRSLSVEGTAVALAARKIKDKARRYAANLFGMPENLVVWEGGKAIGTPAPEKAVMPLQQIAFTLWLAVNLPEGMDPGLEATAYFNPGNFNFPFGTHVAIVEVDEETGVVEVVKYVAVDDFGTVVNPKVVDGQTHGNIALGLGQALREEMIYDEKGRILTADFSTYPISRATDFPEFELERTVTPSPVNTLGAKGAGDTSNPPVAPAVVNAVVDALADLGIRHIEMPLTPERVWSAIEGARAAGKEVRK